ncbi:hypothetical protein KCU95_g2930, partial [Aureobasidium melanogenum]
MDDDWMGTDAGDSDYMDTDASDSDDDDIDLEVTDAEILDLAGWPKSDGDDDMDREDSGPRNNWHGNDPLLRTIGLGKLNDMGYVNLESIYTDRTFGYSGDRALDAARWRAEYETQIGLYTQVNEISEGKYGKLDEYHRIHSIFRQDNWNSDDLFRLGYESTDSFNKLKPVLQLATLLLEDENMVGYIFGMLDLDSHNEITFGDIGKRLDRKIFSFEQRHNLSETERQTVWRELYELSKHVSWTEKEAIGEMEGLYGLTKGKRGFVEIVLDKQNIDYVCRGASPIEDAIDWTPGSDEESARLRVKFVLATTMVHEVMHTLWGNKYHPDGEPFYMNTRMAELGHQWEQLLYSGQIDNPTSQDRGSPCILSIGKWPSPDDEEGESPTKIMSHKKWGSTNVWHEFAVEMSYVQNMFTHKFWAEVDRYGISNFWPRRMLGVRRTLVSEYWKAESPVVRGPDDGELPSPDGADSRGIIDKH